MSVYVKVINPDQVIFEGEVDQVTSSNKIGRFDILENHSNFICLVENFILLKKGGDTKEIKIDKGVLKVEKNKVSVYLGVKK